MGYRSEVAIKCEEKAFEMIKEACYKVEVVPDKVYKEDNCYILWWSWIKWDDWYDDILEIETVLKELDKLKDPLETGTGYGYKFIRIGENDDDVETKDNDWNIELWMIRKIDIQEGLEEIEFEEE